MRPLFALLILCFTALGPAQSQQSALAPATKPQIRLDTNYGTILLELEPERAPRTVANFLAYVKAGHFKGTIFHRVIPGFMIQGGGHTEDLTEKPTLPPVMNEAKASGLKNLLGTVAMARTEDPDSASAQFFINTADNASLDPSATSPGYTVFGRVVGGMDVVQKIEQVRTVWRKGMQNVPDYPVRIKAATLLNP